MAYIGKQPVVGNFQVCDAISVVNGQAAYTMQVASTNVEPENANHMLVSLNGILQKPGSSFTISGSTITFASNLATGDVIDFIILLGDVLNIGAPSDDTVTAAKLNNDIISGQTALTSAPDGTDEFLISDGGTIKRIDASLVGRGKLLQVVTANDSTTRSTTSTSFVTASNTMSVDITPSSTSSKIYLNVTGNAYVTTSSAYFIGTIFRDSTDLGGSSNKGLGNLYKNPDDAGGFLSISVLDSPSSTSQITYSFRFLATAGTAYLNENSSKGTITAFEIAG